MQSKQTRGRSGGRAGGAGYDYQDVYIAWQLAKMLMGEADPIVEVLWEKKTIDSGNGAEAVYVDDAIVRRQSGEWVYTQLKESSTSWTARNLIQSGVLAQFWQQWDSTSLESRDKIRLQLASTSKLDELEKVNDAALRSRTPAELMSHESAAETIEYIKELAKKLSLPETDPALHDFLRRVGVETLPAAHIMEGWVANEMVIFGEAKSNAVNQLIRIVAQSKHIGPYSHSTLTRDQLIQQLKASGFDLNVLVAAGLVTAGSTPPPSSASIAEFLDLLALNGLMENVVYLPAKLTATDDTDSRSESPMTAENITAFCIDVRVIDEQEWQRKVSCGAEVGHSPSDAFAVSEELARMDGSNRTTPEALQSVLASRRRVVLIGEPGEGKTTSLFLHVAHQCRQLAKRLRDGNLHVDDAECCIPLPLPLAKAAPTGHGQDPSNAGQTINLTGRAQHEAFRIAYRNNDGAPPDLKKWLSAKANRGEVDLCLDALDELDARWYDALRDELKCHQHVGIFLTTRSFVDDAKVILNARRYRLTGFDGQQVRDYISRYFAHGDNGGQFSRELRDQLRLSPGPQQLARIPLLLALLCDWLNTRHDLPLEKIRERIPKTRTQLLRNALHSLMERGDKKRCIPTTFSPSQRNRAKESALRHVAWHFFATGPLPIVHEKLLEILDKQLKRDSWKGYEPPKNAEALLVELLQDGVLVAGREQGIYRFVLRSLHEYCLAGWIARECLFVTESDQDEFTAMLCGRTKNWERSNDWPDIKPLNQPGWRHVWASVAGQLDTRANWLTDALFQEDEDIARTRLLFAASACVEGDVSLNYQSKIIDDLTEAIRRESTPQKVRWMCSKVLGRIRDARAHDALSAIVADEHSHHEAQMYCMSALGELGDDRACETLATALKQHDKGGPDSHSCVHALTETQNSKATQYLVESLSNRNLFFGLRSQCAEALGEIGDELSREALLAVLDDESENKSVRVSCAIALATLGDDRVQGTLITSLDDEEIWEHTRGRCAEALGRFSNDEAITALSAALRNDRLSRYAGENCVKALCQHETDRVRDTLIDLLHDEKTPWYTRRACARGLGEMNDDRARQAQYDALVADFYNEQLSDWKRQEIARDLLGIRDGLRGQTHVWQEGEANMRRDWVAGQAEHSEALVAEVYYQQPWEHQRSCRDLAGVSHVSARQIVSSALRDERIPEPVRENLCWQLSRIGDDDALQTLADAMFDRQMPKALRVKCATSLADADDSRPRNLLIEIVCDSNCDDLTREFCVDALGKISDSQVIQFLTATMLDETFPEVVRVRCARRLGDIGSEEARQVMADALHGQQLSRWVRNVCADALGDLGDERACDALVVMLNDDTVRDLIRAGAAEALANIGNEAACQMLVEKCQRLEGVGVRWVEKWVEILGAKESECCRHTLATILNSDLPEETVRRKAAEMLVEITHKGWRFIAWRSACKTDPHRRGNWTHLVSI